jgi:acetyl esterase
VTDHDFTRPSYVENAEGPLLKRVTMEWFWDHYAPNESDRDSPDASPIKAASLAGLPPAYVITSELDPLRDEGEAYAARLQESGVPVSTKRHDGQFHNFNMMAAALPKAQAAVKEIASAIKAAVAG